MPISESQKRATEKYNKKNKEKHKYWWEKSIAKKFVKNTPNINDLEEIQILINLRKKEITK